MRTRQTNRTARGAAAVALAASLAFSLAGCGSSGGKPNGAPAGSQSPATAQGGSSTSGVGQSDNQVLATIKGPQGIVFTLTSAKREAGGFVTVSGTLKNTGTEPFTATSDWRGNESAVEQSGPSLSGATLVDPQGKKRYYILRDTEGRCLCTTGLTIISAGQTRIRR